MDFIEEISEKLTGGKKDQLVMISAGLLIEELQDLLKHK